MIDPNDVFIMDDVAAFSGVVLSHEDVSQPFVPELLVLTNSVFFKLNELGVGPTNPFVLTNLETPWSAFFEDTPYRADVVLYVLTSVKMLFDPSPNATIMQAFKSVLTEMENRFVYRN